MGLYYLGHVNPATINLTSVGERDFRFVWRLTFEVDGFAWSRRAMPRADGTTTTEEKEEKKNARCASRGKAFRKNLGFDGPLKVCFSREGRKHQTSR